MEGRQRGGGVSDGGRGRGTVIGRDKYTYVKRNEAERQYNAVTENTELEFRVKSINGRKVKLKRERERFK